MKNLLFILLWFIPAIAFAQQGIMGFKIGGQYGVKNKTFNLDDIRDFPSFSEYSHPDGFYFDTIVSANLITAQWHKNIKTWLAANFTSLPDILKLDDTDHIVIHSAYDLNNFTFDFRMKNGKAKILLTDFETQESMIAREAGIRYYYNVYTTNHYDGGKRSKYNEKKKTLIILNDFQILADWLRNNCIPSISKLDSF